MGIFDNIPGLTLDNIPGLTLIAQQMQVQTAFNTFMASGSSWRGTVSETSTNADTWEAFKSWLIVEGATTDSPQLQAAITAVQAAPGFGTGFQQMLGNQGRAGSPVPLTPTPATEQQRTQLQTAFNAFMATPNTDENRARVTNSASNAETWAAFQAFLTSSGAPLNTPELQAAMTAVQANPGQLTQMQQAFGNQGRAGSNTALTTAPVGTALTAPQQAAIDALMPEFLQTPQGRGLLSQQTMPTPQATWNAFSNWVNTAPRPPAPGANANLTAANIAAIASLTTQPGNVTNPAALTRSNGIFQQNTLTADDRTKVNAALQLFVNSNHALRTGLPANATPAQVWDNFSQWVNDPSNATNATVTAAIPVTQRVTAAGPNSMLRQSAMGYTGPKFGSLNAQRTGSGPGQEEEEENGIWSFLKKGGIMGVILAIIGFFIGGPMGALLGGGLGLFAGNMMGGDGNPLSALFGGTSNSPNVAIPRKPNGAPANSTQHRFALTADGHATTTPQQAATIIEGHYVGTGANRTFVIDAVAVRDPVTNQFQTQGNQYVMEQLTGDVAARTLAVNAQGGVVLFTGTGQGTPVPAVQTAITAARTQAAAALAARTTQGNQAVAAQRNQDLVLRMQAQLALTAGTNEETFQANGTTALFALQQTWNTRLTEMGVTDPAARSRITAAMASQFANGDLRSHLDTDEGVQAMLAAVNEQPMGAGFPAGSTVATYLASLPPTNGGSIATNFQQAFNATASSVGTVIGTRVGGADVTVQTLPAALAVITPPQQQSALAAGSVTATVTARASFVVNTAIPDSTPNAALLRTQVTNALAANPAATQVMVVPLQNGGQAVMLGTVTDGRFVASHSIGGNPPRTQALTGAANTRSFAITGGNQVIIPASGADRTNITGIIVASANGTAGPNNNYTFAQANQNQPGGFIATQLGNGQPLSSGQILG